MEGISKRTAGRLLVLVLVHLAFLAESMLEFVGSRLCDTKASSPSLVRLKDTMPSKDPVNMTGFLECSSRRRRAVEGVYQGNW